MEQGKLENGKFSFSEDDDYLVKTEVSINMGEKISVDILAAREVLKELSNEGATGLVVMSGNLMKRKNPCLNPLDSPEVLFRKLLEVTLKTGCRSRIGPCYSAATKPIMDNDCHERNKLFGLGNSAQDKRSLSDASSLATSLSLSFSPLSMAASAADPTCMSNENFQVSDLTSNSSSNLETSESISQRSMSFSDFQHICTSPPHCFVPIFQPMLNRGAPCIHCDGSDENIWLIHDPSLETVDCKQRDILKVTCKFFLPVATLLKLHRKNSRGVLDDLEVDSFVTTAVQSLCTSLKVTYLDSLVLALDMTDVKSLVEKESEAPLRSDLDTIDQSGILYWLTHVWPVLEKLKQEGLIKKIGIVDLNQEEFEAFLTYLDGTSRQAKDFEAPNSDEVPLGKQYYPFTNQIYVVSPCSSNSEKGGGCFEGNSVAAEDESKRKAQRETSLLAFAKTKDISLTTHRDPPSLLPFLEPLFPPLKTDNMADIALPLFELAWCFRYSFFIPSRHVMSNMAYMVAFAKL